MTTELLLGIAVVNLGVLGLLLVRTQRRLAYRQDTQFALLRDLTGAVHDHLRHDMAQHGEIAARVVVLTMALSSAKLLSREDYERAVAAIIDTYPSDVQTALWSLRGGAPRYPQ